MSQRALRCAPVLLAAVTLCVPVARAQKGPALADLLTLATAYLATYAEQIGTVVAEEEYLQYEITAGQMRVPKRVTSDVGWLGQPGAVPEGFRDVTAIDTVSVRPRDQRLLALLKTPGAAGLTSARQLTQDSVRQYIDGNLHALDQPMLALEFLLPANQGRSTFKIESVKSMNGAQVATVKFTEHDTPRLVPSPEQGPAVGRFWIDTATGAVRQTELGIGARTSNVRVQVRYGLDAGTGLWLPVEMYQQSDISGGASSAGSNMGSGGGYSGHQSLEGRATYAKFRQAK